ncbi:MAG: phage major capsid protein [Bacillota bacterium]
MKLSKLRESMSTSDFTNLLSNDVNKLLQRGYERVQAQSNWRKFSKIVPNIPDFKNKSIIRITEGEELLEVKELGEYRGSKIADNKMTYKLGKFGRRFGVSWESIKNDDLDAITKQPDRFGRAYGRSLNKFVIQELLVGNPNTYDAKAVFHVDHGNLVHVAFSEPALIAGVVAMRKQTDDNGNPLNIGPMALIVPPELGIPARKVVNTAVIPGTTGDNVLRGIVTVFEEALITDADSWYLVADPNDIDTIEVGFLEGIGDTPQLFIKDPDARLVGGGDVDPMEGSFDNDGIDYKVRGVWGGCVPDYRGLYASIPA